MTAMLCIVFGAVGCRERIAEFEPDAVLRATSGLTAEQSASIDSALRELFGTPNEPNLPVDLPRLAELCDLSSLEQAAGPVASHEVGVVLGLYRRHCARCHGVTGDGRGPTARYQSPYPRDFRRGVFKWKSTYRDAAPTAADLDRVLEHGVPGTAMPSFRLVSQKERDILRQYVIYLAIRGQAERVLVDFAINELPTKERLAFDGELRDEIIADYLAPIVDAWADAASLTVAPPADFEGIVRSQIELGRELYHSERAGCYKCHGREGKGGAIGGKDFEVDYDLWNRDRSVAKPSAAIAEQLKRDLPIRPSAPRQLVGETPHGGVRAVDLYRRVHQGVAGTPMPAVGGATPGERGSLTDNEVAAVVAYLQSFISQSQIAENSPADQLVN